jgi:hypothetical protein
MPIEPSISITTPVTQLLGINHPILLAPMAYVTDARLVNSNKYFMDTFKSHVGVNSRAFFNIRI